MKKKPALILIILISAVFIALLAPYTINAELFTPKDIQGTQNNLNPNALKQLSSENSDNVLLMMQEFVDISGTIIINIRHENIEEARENLEEYSRKLQKFDDVLIKLDMTQSEINDYQNSNREQFFELENLTDNIEGLEELKKLQIQYRDSDDPDKYYSVIYGIDELEEKIKDNREEISDNTNEIIEKGAQFELNTDDLKESAKEIANIGFIENNQSSYYSPVTKTGIINVTQAKTVAPEAETEDDSFFSPFEKGNLINTLVFLAIILIFASAGVIYYNKKSGKKTRNNSRSKTTEEYDETDNTEVISIITDDSSEMTELEPETETFRKLLRTLFQKVALRENIQYRPSMTNNEFVSDLSAPDELKQFTHLYEKIVYASNSTKEDKNRLIKTFNDLIKKYMEEDE